MALIDCTECGGKVSDRAKACPHCGRLVVALVQQVPAGAKTPPFRPVQNLPPRKQPATPTAHSRLQASPLQPAVAAVQPPARTPKPPGKSISWRFKLSACVFWFFAATCAAKMLLGVEPFSPFIGGAISFAIGMWQWNCAQKHAKAYLERLKEAEASSLWRNEPPQSRPTSASPTSGSTGPAIPQSIRPTGRHEEGPQRHSTGQARSDASAERQEEVPQRPSADQALPDVVVASANRQEEVPQWLSPDQPQLDAAETGAEQYEDVQQWLNALDPDQPTGRTSRLATSLPATVMPDQPNELTHQKSSDAVYPITDLPEAIRLDPNDAKAYYNRAIAYQKKGNHDQAIVDFTEAIRLDPDDADAYYERGWAYGNKGERARAEADFSEAKRLGHP